MIREERLLKIILSPVISEKSTLLADKHRQFVFKVIKDAKKPEIKSAIERLFKVEVNKVTVVTIPGKKVRFGQTEGYRSGYKKAYISLKEGFDIDFTVSDTK